MPKLIPEKTRMEIIKLAQDMPQTKVSKHFNVSRMFVNALINNRPIKRTRPLKNECPITGYTTY